MIVAPEPNGDEGLRPRLIKATKTKAKAKVMEKDMIYEIRQRQRYGLPSSISKSSYC